MSAIAEFGAILPRDLPAESIYGTIALDSGKIMKRKLPLFLILASFAIRAFCANSTAPQDPFDSPPLAVGTFAPHFISKTITGKIIDSKSFLGHVTVLDFWATWCIPCRASMPALEKLSKDYANKGVQVIGMSGDTYSIN